MAATALTSSLSHTNTHPSFLSVFPASIRPPRNRQQFEADISQLAAAKKQIGSDFRTIMGTGNENYALPGVDARAFKPHFISCSPINIIQQPTAQDRLTLVTHMLRSPSIRQIKIWSASLGLSELKKMFATVIDKCLDDFVVWAYSGIYNEEVQQHVKFWAEHVLSEYINVFQSVTREDGVDARRIQRPTSAEIQKYQDMALGRLWALRVNELFDMIVDWDQTVAGIDDLKTLISTPQARQYVTESFTKALQTRLLHPGASTIEILQIYIATIRAFRRLDPRGVLLSKVSGRVRQYLRERDDTIKVVVAGLLSDISIRPEERTSDPTDVLTELAWELQNHDSSSGRATSNLDWNNMEWQPDPIDAVPESWNTRASKHTDVIGSVISLFESKDVFVRELQITLAERLLRNKEDYDQETSVLEHLKIRFGDTALQACEVMLRDVLDSRRLDQTIRKDQGLDIISEKPITTRKEEAEPELHAKILSRLFWPSLPGSTPAYGEDDEKHFKPPLHILHQRERYEAGFESLKQTRKLTWNDHLGAVSLELTFADGRTYIDEILPYQAGVIYAFNDDSSHNQDVYPADRNDLAPTRPISKSVEELSEELGLMPTLVRSACLLFVSKRVLTPTPSHPDTFSVLEYLNPTDAPITAAADIRTHQHTAPVGSSSEVDTDSAAAAAAAIQAQSERAAELAAHAAAKDAEQREKRAKMAVYQQFVTAMLTNQGAMPLGRIAMMLGMVVPGGFPYSNEELREFLQAMIREGVVEMVGSNYRKAA